MTTKDFAIKVGQDEIGRILNLKENLDHNGLWLDYVSRYQARGWALTAINARDGSHLGLDFSQPREVWSRKLADLGMEEIQVNVGILTGAPSRLLVLEVNRGEGALALDQLGQWRSECVAEVGDSREQHYYALPPERNAPPSFFLAPEALIYGDGGLVLAPPSIEPQGREPWRWRRAPWESPPRPPKPAVWQFIRDRVQGGGSGTPDQPQVLPWEEVYRVIAPFGTVLKALLVPAPSAEVYYQWVLAAALGVGITDPETLLGLLWHAPHGDARHRPGRWDYLLDLVAAGPPSANGEAGLLPAPEVPAAFPGLGAWNLAEMPWGSEGLNLPADFVPGSLNSPDKLDATVSGQFFQLLAGLGERVIVESCRYEAMRHGMQLGSAEIRRRMQEWDQRFSPPTGPSEEAGDPLPPEAEAGSSDLAQAWVAVMPSEAQASHFQDLRAAALDFLSQNPDLAADRQKILMVIFCLKNYIAINPEYAVLPFREKLEKAGKMARVFLWEKDVSLENS